MTFHGWCYPLEDYARAMGDAGLLIETIREPAASETAVRKTPSWAGWQRLPFLQLAGGEARRSSGAGPRPAGTTASS